MSDSGSEIHQHHSLQKSSSQEDVSKPATKSRKEQVLAPNCDDNPREAEPSKEECPQMTMAGQGL